MPCLRPPCARRLPISVVSPTVTASGRTFPGCASAATPIRQVGKWFERSQGGYSVTRPGRLRSIWEVSAHAGERGRWRCGAGSEEGAAAHGLAPAAAARCHPAAAAYRRRPRRLPQQLRRTVHLRRHLLDPEQPAHPPALASVAGALATGALYDRRPPARELLAGGQLRAGWPGRPGLPRVQPGRARARGAGALRCRPPHADGTAPPVRGQQHDTVARTGSGIGLDGPPAADRERHLRRPAHRIVDGTLLPSDAVLRHPRPRFGTPAWLVRRCRRRECDGYGMQGGHGHGPPGRAALRPHLLLRVFPRGVARPISPLRQPGEHVAGSGRCADGDEPPHRGVRSRPSDPLGLRHDAAGSDPALPPPGALALTAGDRLLRVADRPRDHPRCARGGGLLGATLWALYRRRAVAFLGAWFFLILAPTSSIRTTPART